MDSMNNTKYVKTCLLKLYGMNNASV